jgi:hypothetical protein
VVEFQRHEGTDTHPPTVMTSDRYLGRRTDDPSGLGTNTQWTFSLVPVQLHRAPLSTTNGDRRGARTSTTVALGGLR